MRKKDKLSKRVQTKTEITVDAVSDVCTCGRSRGSSVHSDGAINGHAFEDEQTAGAEKAAMLDALKKLGRLHGNLERARKSGEDYTLDVVAEPLLATMKVVGELTLMLLASLP